MRAAIFISSAFTAVALAQSTTSTGDAFPQTSFLTQTNSLSVVTGQPTLPAQDTTQPALETTQPALETSVGVPESIPAVGTTGIHTVTVGHADNTTSTYTVSASNSTTSIIGALPSGSGSGSGSRTPGTTPTGSNGASGSPTGSGTSSSSTGAAATMRAVAGSLVGAGAFVAAFL